MPVTVNLNSGIFDKLKRTQALSNAISKTLIEFAAYVEREQVESVPTGRTYRRKGGAGFRRSHRASARGQRPAIDTGKLLNSTKHKKTGPFKGEVTTIAKRDGFDYASQLQFKMDRPIQGAEDVMAGERIMTVNALRALKNLS